MTTKDAKDAKETSRELFVNFVVSLASLAVQRDLTPDNVNSRHDPKRPKSAKDRPAMS